MQVRAYAAVFFARYKELPDHDKYLKQIERGEQKIQRQLDIMKVQPPRPPCGHGDSACLAAGLRLPRPPAASVLPEPRDAACRVVPGHGSRREQPQDAPSLTQGVCGARS